MAKISREIADEFRLWDGRNVKVYKLTPMVTWFGNMDILASGNLVKEIGPEPFFLLNMFTIEDKKLTIDELSNMDMKSYEQIIDSIQTAGTDLTDLFKK